jgi:hypothetical protein
MSRTLRITLVEGAWELRSSGLPLGRIGSCGTGRHARLRLCAQRRGLCRRQLHRRVPEEGWDEVADPVVGRASNGMAPPVLSIWSESCDMALANAPGWHVLRARGSCCAPSLKPCCRICWPVDVALATPSADRHHVAGAGRCAGEPGGVPSLCGPEEGAANDGGGHGLLSTHKGPLPKG